MKFDSNLTKNLFKPHHNITPIYGPFIIIKWFGDDACQLYESSHLGFYNVIKVEIMV
jgi:hypothetical protein